MLEVWGVNLMNIDLKKVKNVYFIGIGGIGMSAMAQFFLSENKKVSGSDLGETPVTELLEKKGVKVFLKQSPENISDDTNLVVYTLAIDKNDPELEEAKKRNISIISYPEALGLISKNKYTIAVSGAHGKTTTTAMIAKIMIDAGLSPSVIAGSLMNEYKSNFVAGESDYLVVEACEYKRSFLHLEPNVLVITNIEREHLDYYKDLSDIQDSFTELARKLKKDDFLVCDVESKNLEPVIEDRQVECNILDYHSIKTDRLSLKVPGKHNEENAKAALTVAAIFSIKENIALKSLKDFKGTWRRMEEKGKTKNGALVYDDYAHHPTEITASLSSLKKLFPDKKIVVAFQPHLFSRTKSLLPDFADTLKEFSESITLPIYAAREKFDPEISSKILSEEIKKVGGDSQSFEDFSSATKYLQNSFDSRHIIVTMGAGDVYKISENLTSNH